jgi:hypothetical protein
MDAANCFFGSGADSLYVWLVIGLSAGHFGRFWSKNSTDNGFFPYWQGWWICMIFLLISNTIPSKISATLDGEVWAIHQSTQSDFTII